MYSGPGQHFPRAGTGDVAAGTARVQLGRADLLLVSNSVTINPYMARQGAAPPPGLNFYPTVSVPLLQIPCD